MCTIFEEVRQTCAAAVHRNRGAGVLFSGGLDSAIVAAFAADARTVSVSLEHGGDDIYYAQRVADYLKLDHRHRVVTVDEAIEAIPDVIRITESFDPVVPNNLTVYFGLQCAVEMGLPNILTGDGSDELFAGYDFMLEMENLGAYLARMRSTMGFSSNVIGRELGIDIRQPFLDESIVAIAKAVDLDLKVKYENGRLWGKWILRKAFEGILPHDVLWQGKRPLESGSGMTELRRILEHRVSNEEFNSAKRHFPVKFWNREHYYYYRIYREVVGDVPAPAEGQKICHCCGTGMNHDTFHCEVCGDVVPWNNNAG